MRSEIKPRKATKLLFYFSWNFVKLKKQFYWTKQNWTVFKKHTSTNICTTGCIRNLKSENIDPSTTYFLIHTKELLTKIFSQLYVLRRTLHWKKTNGITKIRMENSCDCMIVFERAIKTTKLPFISEVKCFKTWVFFRSLFHENVR